MASDIHSALAIACQNAENIFVIGGSTLYKALLPLADTLYITQIHESFNGDTFFPVISPDDWTETEREDIDDDPAVSFSYSFLTMEKMP